MEWTSCEKQSVKRLLHTVYRARVAGDAWIWLLKCISFLERHSHLDWATWQIAQALLFTQTTRWPLRIWRQNLGNLRRWQFENRSCSITPTLQPEQLYNLFQMLKDYGKLRLPLRGAFSDAHRTRPSPGREVGSSSHSCFWTFNTSRLENLALQ